jgi:chromosome segregation ATPase
MMAPLPPFAGSAGPSQRADADLHLPEVRLDVRVGSGRAAGYDLTRGEFLVGGADGCDLTLSGAHVPPVVCQIARTPNGVTLRRIAPAFPILLNGSPVSGGDPVTVGGGDRVAVGSADLVVTVHGRGHLRPKFQDATKGQPKPIPGAFSTPTPSPQFAAEERAALDRYREQLAAQARELEADRVAWYRRRQEIEAEVRALQESATTGSKLIDREAWLQKREAEQATRERELNRVRDELAEIRQTLFDQYRERREQVEQMQQAVTGASSSFQQRQAQLEADLDRRRRELDAEATRLQEYVTAEVNRRAAEAESDFARRRLELEAMYDARLRQFEEQAAQRRTRFEDELRAFEPRLADLHAQREQLGSAFRELETQKTQLASQRDGLARERAALDAERKWQDERHAERERLHEAREAEIARQAELVHADRDLFDQDRHRLADDLLRLDRWQAAVEDRQLLLDRRAADIDQQVRQLTRDAVELEDHVRLADAEQRRLAVEAARLDELKAELEARTSHLADRSAQVEAQQASLAVLRARLDRQQDDLHREAAALTADRARLDATQRELDVRLTDAEHLRASLGTVHLTHAQAEQAQAERQALLDAALADVRQQKDHLTAEEERLRRKESELDARTADLAEQTAVLKAKTAQAIDLHQRLETDRSAVRTRESTLTEADAARVAFQEQLRKRSDALTARGRELDALASQLADDRLVLDRLRAEITQDRDRGEHTIGAARQQLAEREAELTRQSELLAEREAALARQVDRLRDTGRAVAAGRKALFAAKQQWQTEQATLVEQTLAARRELEAFRTRALTELNDLRQHAPQLEDQAAQTLDRLTAAREVLRNQLAELHAYASQSRDTLDAIRTDLRAEGERLRGRETDLEKARTEHRLAVSEFRAQLHDWQAKVGELKTAMTRTETRIEQKQADLEAAARKTDETALELARRMEQLRLDRDDLSERRSQVERHLCDMREWYRHKLRDLAAGNRHELPDQPRLAADPPVDDLEPGDRHLGELLRRLELVDADALEALWDDARRQHRTLRQVLLASGAVTLYQLALIEAGNLDALMLGRFRVIDRVRVTPREAAYRVFDPQRGGVFVLRVLGDAEMHDATRPDEYRQRFAAAAEAVHPHLTAVLEVLEVNGRPAAVQEAAAGLPGSEWPAAAAVPGVWRRLLAEAAAAIDLAHRHGLVHGRLTAESFVLTPGGLKVVGFGDPPWLAAGLPPAFDPTPDADLRALGQAAFGWTMLGGKKKGRGAKGFPEPLLAVLRRLETDPENPMGDTVTGAEPYRSAADLLADLIRLASRYPCPDDAWAELLARVPGATDEPGARKAG